MTDTEKEALCARIDELCAEVERLREQIEHLQPTDSDGNVLDIADTVHMLRSEYDGDHEWEDVVTELALNKWGGDRWIVRGSKGEAWACDCTKTGHDEDAYEASDDVEPFDDATLAEAENAKLRELANGYEALTATLCNERGCDGCPFDGTEQIVCEHMRLQTCLSELGVEV